VIHLDEITSSYYQGIDKEDLYDEALEDMEVVKKINLDLTSKHFLGAEKYLE
jgi:hypothetical protein